MRANTAKTLFSIIHYLQKEDNKCSILFFASLNIKLLLSPILTGTVHTAICTAPLGVRSVFKGGAMGA